MILLERPRTFTISWYGSADLPFWTAVKFDLLSGLIGYLARYFSYEVEGLERIPRVGGALLVSNHGFVVFDGLLLGRELLERRDRILKVVIERVMAHHPLLKSFWSQLGAIPGGPHRVEAVLKAGHPVLVYPGGTREGFQLRKEKYKLYWEGRMGFAKVAIRAGVPIIPIAALGTDDAFDVEPRIDEVLSWLIGNKKDPMPAFRGLGPLRLPYPVRIRQIVGHPIDHGFPPEAADDPAAVKSLYLRSRDALQGMLDEARRPIDDVDRIN